VCCYAPTNVAKDEAKDAFYDELNECLRNIPRKEAIVLAGDFNATLGPCQAADSRFLGKHCIDRERNDNGHRFISLLSHHDLFAVNTRFRHKRRHMETFKSNDRSKIRKQIDFICVRSRWKSSALSCRSYWGTALESDHALLVSRMRVRLEKVHKPKRPPRLALEQLRDPSKRMQFCNALSTQLNNISEHGPGEIESLWDATVSSILQTASDTIDRRKHHRNDWISPATLALVNARKNANTRIARKELTAQINVSIDQDKHHYWNLKADEMNNANRHGNTGKLFRTLKDVAGKKHGSCDTVREDDGTVIHSAERKLDRWREYYDSLLNRPAPTEPMFAIRPNRFSDVRDDPPDLAEVERAIKSLRSQSAPGEDGISAELLKAGGLPLAQHLTRLVQKIWSHQTFPSRWKTSVLFPLFKKGDRSVCKNYRGISLIDVAYKLVEAVILDRIRPAVECYLRENQCGFRPGRSTVDQIFALRQIIELRSKFKRPLYVTFVDFKAAFDSVDRSRMYEVLERSIGLPHRIVALIAQMYDGSVDVVRVGQSFSKAFPVKTGVKQGALLSPLLFNIVLDCVLDVAMDGCEGVMVDGNRVTDLDYADDLALMAESASSMQTMVDRLDKIAAAVGLTISAEKTQTMRSLGCIDTPITLRGVPLVDVPKFCYLGSTIAVDGESSPEIQARIAKAQSAFSMLEKQLWSVQRIDLKTKIRVYLAAVRPVLLYACETWPMKVADERKLQAFEFRCWRRILGVSYLDRVSNREIINRIRPPSVCSEELCKRRLNYLGHVLRKTESSIPRRAFLADPPACWKRPTGGEKMTWQKTVLKDLRKTNPQHVFAKWEDDWKSILSTVCTDRAQWSTWVARVLAGDGVAFSGRR
jgi:hypothetical protein